MEAFEKGCPRKCSSCCALQMASARATRTVVETEQSYRNDTIEVFFFMASQKKDNAKVSLVFLILHSRSLGQVSFYKE